MKGTKMDPQEKMNLKDELDKAIHPHPETTGTGRKIDRTIIEPESLKEVLHNIIEAIPADEL